MTCIDRVRRTQGERLEKFSLFEYSNNNNNEKYVNLSNTC